MSTMPIEYLEPFGRAWTRMKALLFQPFDFGRWIVIGFTAWLATLTEGGGGGGGNFNLPVDDKSSWKAVGTYLHQHLALVIGVAAGVLALGILLGLVLTWLSARGKFMFLENAVTGGAEIAAPWRRWRRQGNSLFWWQVAYGAIMLTLVLLVVGLCLALAWHDIHAHRFGGRALAATLGGFFLLLPLLLTGGFILVFLYDFVVPLMRRHDLGTNAAWRRFLPLLRAHFGAFLLYSLLRGVLSVLLAMAVSCAGCFACLFTCGCAGCLLILPFVGTLVLLPVIAWERYWGPEFLRQFGPEFDVWTGRPPPPLPAPPAGADRPLDAP